MQAPGAALIAVPVALLPCMQACGAKQDGAAHVAAAQPNLGAPGVPKPSFTTACADSCSKHISSTGAVSHPKMGS